MTIATADAILIATGGPTRQGGLASWYSKLATETLQDAERRWLVEQGASTGITNKGMWSEVLKTAGHEGTVDDMLHQYWVGEAFPRGPELLTNGGFTTDTNWVKETWTISGGRAHAQVDILNGQRIYQTGVAWVQGLIYEIKVTTLNGIYGDKGFQVIMGGLTGADFITSDGNHVFPMDTTPNIFPGECAFLPFNESGPTRFSGDIDNVSVREIL